MVLTHFIFDYTIPQNSLRSIYFPKQAITQKYPDFLKAISSSRFIGIYQHYEEYMPIFHLGYSLHWVDHAERQTREYLEQRICHTSITKTIFLVENDQEILQYLRPLNQEEKGKDRIQGNALRMSFALSTCYKKAFVFQDDTNGMELLKLFRSFPCIEDMFLQAVFTDKQLVPEGIVDGIIEGEKYVVLFLTDLMKIRQLSRILEFGILERLSIVCFDFQQPLYQKIFAPWEKEITYSTHSLKLVYELFFPKGKDEVYETQ